MGEGEDSSLALRELDLHFDPYSDDASAEYEKLKQSFEKIDISFLLDLEREKSQPDAFVLAQIGRALKFQEPAVAVQLCATLLDPNNLDSFRASWSKIMRGVYAVRSNDQFVLIFAAIDALLDRIPSAGAHLLVPEANMLHFLRAIRFTRTDLRGAFVRQTYDMTASASVRRACIDCWRYWADRSNFTRIRNQWQNLGAGEQRMLWVAAGAFGDEGMKTRDQLRGSLATDLATGVSNPAQLVVLRPATKTGSSMPSNRLPARDPRTVARDIPGVLDVLFPRLTGGLVNALNARVFSFPSISPIPNEVIEKSRLQKAMMFELSMARAESELRAARWRRGTNAWRSHRSASVAISMRGFRKSSSREISW